MADMVDWLYDSAGRHLGVQLDSDLYKPAEELNDAVFKWTRQASQSAFFRSTTWTFKTPTTHTKEQCEEFSRRRVIKLFRKANELQGNTPGEDIETLKSPYRGEIEYLERQLGDLQAVGRDAGLRGDRRGVHLEPRRSVQPERPRVPSGYALYEKNIHIPLVLRGPDVGEREVETPVSNVHLVPTLLSGSGSTHRRRPTEPT